MKYFYCQSYQAFNMALSINLESEVTIISAAENIIEACKYMGIKCVSHKSFSIKEIVSNKNYIIEEINRLIGLIGKNELHFSHTQFAIFCFILVTNAKEKGAKVVFHNFELVYDKVPLSLINIKLLKKKSLATAINLLYQIPVEIRIANANIFVPSLKINFIKNNFKWIENKSEYFDLTIKMFKKIEIEHLSIENLFIAQTFTNENVFSYQKIEKLLPLLNSDSFYVKMHPKLGSVKGLEKCNLLPEFLPVELFFNKVANCVLSFQSAALITASKFENVKAISLLDLVKQADSFNERVKNDLMLKSDNKILFPQNINELKAILSS